MGGATGQRLLTGVVSRVDLERKLLVVVPALVASEMEILLDDPQLRLTRLGRSLRLEEIAPGELVRLVYEDDAGGRHHARLVKTGPSRYAVPAPSDAPR